MTLTEVIKAAAERMKDVTVDIDRGMGCVTISMVGEEDIYMQDQEGDEFIEAVDKLYNDAGDVTEDEAALCHAEPFTDLWS